MSIRRMTEALAKCPVQTFSQTRYEKISTTTTGNPML